MAGLSSHDIVGDNSSEICSIQVFAISVAAEQCAKGGDDAHSLNKREEQYEKGIQDCRAPNMMNRVPGCQKGSAVMR